jgi:hypothetical protein
MCPELDSVLPEQHSFIAADVAELLCAGSDTAAFGPSMVSELLIGDNGSSNSSSHSHNNSEQQYRIRGSGSSDCFSGMQLHCGKLAGVHANSSSSDKRTAADLQWEYVNGDSNNTAAAAGDKRKRDETARTAAAGTAAAGSSSSSSSNGGSAKLAMVQSSCVVEFDHISHTCI